MKAEWKPFAAIGQRVAEALRWNMNPTEEEFNDVADFSRRLISGTRVTWENTPDRALILDFASKGQNLYEAHRLVVGTSFVVAGMLLGSPRSGSPWAVLQVPDPDGQRRRTPRGLVTIERDWQWKDITLAECDQEMALIVSALDGATDGYYSYAIEHRPWSTQLEAA